MIRVSLEQIVLVVSILMLLVHSGYCRPRRRFCEIYPYARICLGASAKRSAQQLDVRTRESSSHFLSALIQRLMEEESGKLENKEETRDKQDFQGDNNFLEQLASMVSNTNGIRRPVENDFINEDPNWENTYNSFD